MIFQQAPHIKPSISWTPLGTKYIFSALRSVLARKFFDEATKTLKLAYGNGVGQDEWDPGKKYRSNTWYYRHGDYTVQLYLTSKDQIEYLMLSGIEIKVVT